MSEFLLRTNTLNISLIRAIEDEDDDDNEYLIEVLARKDVDVNALGANTWNTMPTTAIIMATHDYSIIQKFRSRIIRTEHGKVFDNASVTY
jgi:ABC-type polysaccharide/polyol phosphate transport system ATPase subunit